MAVAIDKGMEVLRHADGGVALRDEGRAIEGVAGAQGFASEQRGPDGPAVHVDRNPALRLRGGRRPVNGLETGLRGPALRNQTQVDDLDRRCPVRMGVNLLVGGVECLLEHRDIAPFQ